MRFRTALIIQLLIATAVTLPLEAAGVDFGVLARYHVDSGGKIWVDQASGQQTAVSGLAAVVHSPGGLALRFDGYSTLVFPPPISRLVEDSPWSISCWLKLDALPWNEAAILDQESVAGSLLFGIDAQGRLTAQRQLGTQKAERIVSKEKLPPRAWRLVSLSYHDNAMVFSVNGETIAATRVAPSTPATGGIEQPLVIGRSRTPQFPYPSNAIHPMLPVSYTLEGAIGDLTIRDHVLTGREMHDLLAGRDQAEFQQSPGPALPRWTGGPGPFGAFYTSLHYDSLWDHARRVGPETDVVVRFSQAPIQLVFWQGTNYIPAWVTENGRWYSDEFIEIFGKPRCPDGEDCEPMSDKQVRYSHVDILESTAARAVIRWRYALSEVENQKLADAATPADWGAWADEYWTVYPDAVAVRRQVLWSDDPRREASEFQESIVIIPTGETPEDNINIDALALANLQGDSKTYTWTPRSAVDFAKPRGPDHFTGLQDPMIQWINLRSRWKPFEVAGSSPATFDGINWEPSMSTFEWWNHWPVAQILSSGRPALDSDRPSHSSLSHIYWPIADKGDRSISQVLMTGLTPESAGNLAPLARSWLHPPSARLAGVGSVRYDQSQRAFLVEHVAADAPIQLELSASTEHPLVNPAIIVSGWRGTASVDIEGASGSGLQLGYVDKLEGRTLVAYLPITATSPVIVTLKPLP